jgi:type II secretory pathway pseudopilin PulG
MKKLRSPDRNFGVVELLAVAFILGILTQMLLAVFLRQQQKGWETAAQSDVRNGALAQASFFNENDRYMTDIAELSDEGYKTSGQIDLWISASTDARNVLVEAQHCRGGDRFRWTSGGAHTLERVDRADRKC